MHALMIGLEKSARNFLSERARNMSRPVSVMKNPARTAVEGWHTSPDTAKKTGDFTLTGITIAQSEQGSYFISQIFLEPLH